MNSEIEKLKRQRDTLLEALKVYADPDTYHAISFLCDSPCGEFAEDFDEDHGGDYDRPMPGKAARAAIATVEREK